MERWGSACGLLRFLQEVLSGEWHGVQWVFFPLTSGTQKSYLSWVFYTELKMTVWNRNLVLTEGNLVGVPVGGR